MDLKRPGNHLYLIGETKNELGGSHFTLVNDLQGGQVPTVDPPRAKAIFAAIHRAITAGLVAACHDLSEGGLAAAIAEMAFAGGLGARLELPANRLAPAVLLFSESNTRFLCEVAEARAAEFEQALHSIPLAKIGAVRDDERLRITAAGADVIDSNIYDLKEAWQGPLRY
jgi:phosphoribosylformylglycinamidine synthase